jgi:hypothetical protein
MKRMIVVAAVAAAGATATSALAAGQALSPGAFTTRITGAKPATLNGTWTLAVIGPAFNLIRNRATAATGGATISGNRITFRDLAGPYRCLGGRAIGTYTWKLKAKTLTFKPVKDSCAGRKAVLSHAFTRIG